MAEYICDVCKFIYDDGNNPSWDTLDGDWPCPVCGSLKKMFKKNSRTEKGEKRIRTIT